MDLSFFKKHILVLVMKNKRQMSSKVKYIFLMEKKQLMSSCYSLLHVKTFHFG